LIIGDLIPVSLISWKIYYPFILCKSSYGDSTGKINRGYVGENPILISALSGKDINYSVFFEKFIRIILTIIERKELSYYLCTSHITQVSVSSSPQRKN